MITLFTLVLLGGGIRFVYYPIISYKIISSFDFLVILVCYSVWKRFSIFISTFKGNPYILLLVKFLQLFNQFSYSHSRFF